MTNDGLVWENISLEQGEVFAAVSVESCVGLKWIKVSETKVGIAIDLPSDLPVFDAGKPYKNLEFSTIDLTTGSTPRRAFCVFCTDSSYFEIFEDLCLSLIKVLKSIDCPKAKAKTTVTRAKAWSELFRSGRRELTREQIMGLICELVFLRDSWMSFGRGVSTWFGPDHKSQDFIDVSYAVAVEVKLQTQALMISVSSIYQLEFDGSLFLWVAQLEERDDGESLNELVDSISEQLPPEELADFESKLIRIGYERRSSYDTKYKKKDAKYYDVHEGFPRIIPGTFNGLVKASYALELDEQFDQFVVSAEAIGDALECK